MIAVIFEVIPKSGRAPDYFQHAADLRPILENMDGFISIERFESVTQPGKFVSLSFWRDEACVKCWRSKPEHRLRQKLGRHEIFENYRLRVAQVDRDYGMFERDQVPEDSLLAHA